MIFVHFSENVRTEGNRLHWEVDHLKNITIPGTNISVNYVAAETMLDGKIRCILSEVTNSTQSCKICGATPTQMSKPKGVLHSFKPNKDALKRGGSFLHARLRAFDFFCKFKFHSEFKTWACSGGTNKESYDAMRKELQEDFREKLGLRVYIPLPGQSEIWYSDPNINSLIKTICHDFK